MKLRLSFVALTVLLATAFAAAQTLQGVVKNGTTGKPAANAEVTLLSLASGMSETGHTKTDGSGRFSFSLDDASMPHLVRVTHQEVNYFKMAPPGRNQVDLEIYDAARKIDGIATAVQIMRMQADGGSLQVAELYAVQNSSKPPRSLSGDSTFEVALPDGSVIDEAAARAPNGQPLTTSPTPVPGKKNHYTFNFPLRPGETQFQIGYHLPYSGQTTVKPVLLHDVQHFVAMLPKSMQFSAAAGASFAPMSDETGANVQVASNAKAGQQVAFSISGTGTLADESAQGGEAQAANGGGAMGGGAMGGGQSAGPGGGLGRPIDSPDPLSRYRWPLLAIFGVVLAGGGVYIVNRDKSAAPAAVLATAGVAASASSPRTAAPKPAAAPSSHSNALLEAMKEELFQLEVEHQQGRIGDQEYQQAKAALDQTLKRALARNPRL